MGDKTLMEITRATCRDFRAAVPKALEAFAKQHGLAVDVTGSIPYTDSTMTIKLTFTATTTTTSEPKKVRDWNDHAEHYGFKQTDLGQPFRCGGKIFTITGLRPDATKNNVIAASPRGKEYVFPANTVIAGMFNRS